MSRSMTLVKRPAAERGIVDHGWLLARHSFSFAGYHDPDWVRFRSLRVLNEDTVQPGTGFGTHPHQDMEIVTHVLEGALAHQDSMGRKGLLRPGDVQMMSAGTGITHSEVNGSATEPLHLIQIWILPDRKGHPPGYEDRNFPLTERHNRLCAIASGDGRQRSLRIHQDAVVYAAVLDSGRQLEHRLEAGRGAWLQVARGTIEVDGTSLTAGDGASLESTAEITIRATADAELLLFDLA